MKHFEYSNDLYIIGKNMSSALIWCVARQNRLKDSKVNIRSNWPTRRDAMTTHLTFCFWTFSQWLIRDKWAEFDWMLTLLSFNRFWRTRHQMKAESMFFSMIYKSSLLVIITTHHYSNIQSASCLKLQLWNMRFFFRLPWQRAMLTSECEQ